jgi:aldose 1-epimerase
VQQETDKITLSYQHDDQDIEASGWPWTFNALQTLKLDRHGLKIELSITNTDAQPMPAGLGLHPFSPAPAGTRLFSQFGHELQVDGQGLPVAPKPLSGGVNL